MKKLRFDIFLAVWLIPYFAYSTTIQNQQVLLLLDQISNAAANDPNNGPVALDLLINIAVGEIVEITPASLGKLHIRSNVTIPSYLRAYVFEKIGESPLDRALQFLAKLKQEDLGDLGEDQSGSIWSAAQRALANAKLGQLGDPFQKTEFLEGLAVPLTPISFWAVEQLCNRGSVSSIKVVRAYFNSLSPGNESYGDDQREFCESRMKVITSNADRTKALGSVLIVGKIEAEDERLLLWAMNQLAKLDSKEAEAELRKFRSEVQNTKGSNSQDGRRSKFISGIDQMLEYNRLKRITAPSEIK